MCKYRRKGLNCGIFMYFSLEGDNVTYKNGKELLPMSLLSQIQDYVQGEIIYIPRKEEKRAGWGELNGTKTILFQRNMEIKKRYYHGEKIKDLSEIYHLSEHSIRKIISSK